MLLGAAIALVLVAVVAGGLALRSRDREAAAATAAQRAAVKADARRLAASALTVEQPDLALLTAVEATRLEQSPETYGAVLTLLARQPDVLTRVQGTDTFISLAATPDGATVFLGEFRPVLHAVDAETGEQRWFRDDLAGQVSWLAVSPDGRTLAAMLYGTSPELDALVFLDPATGSERATVDLATLNAFTGASDPAMWGSIGWTASGRLLVSTDSAVVVLDARGRRLSSVPWGRPWWTPGLSWSGPTAGSAQARPLVSGPGVTPASKGPRPPSESSSPTRRCGPWIRAPGGWP